jgi:hypothetical protein
MVFFVIFVIFVLFVFSWLHLFLDALGREWTSA